MKKRLLLYLLTFAFAVTVYVITLSGSRESSPEPEKTRGLKESTWETAGDDSDFVRLGEPEAGDWLAHFPEPGQTFEQYKNEVRNRKTDERGRIYILPLGKETGHFDDVLAAMKDYGEAFFGCECVVAEYQPMPESAYNESRGQYHAGVVLEIMRRSVPNDAVAFAGFTDRDLYVPELNFVFGLGSLGERVGVFSMRRYGENYRTKLRRALKIMNHEIGHVFSMRHCIFYECAMCGSNSLSESDKRPMHLCPVCLKKLCWANGLDPAKRYEGLSEFYSKYGFEEESKWCAARAEKMQKKK